MKILYDTYKDIWKYAANASKMLSKGVLRLMWSVILLAVNSCVYAYLWAFRAIKAKPAVAVAIAVIITSAVWIAAYASVKTRLVSTEYQRDSLQMQVDSVNEAHHTANWEYSRIQK